MNIDDTYQQNAYDLIVNTHSSFFLCGKAGTGKTTLIKNAVEKAGKNCIVVAPTGIAALSAKGQTIHSFFGLPLGVINSAVVGRPRAESIDRIRHSDTIIVDEVSMVRCDVMDAVERTLRFVMENTEPFGGLQMVFVGDLFQLEPIVTDEDIPELKEAYGDIDYHFFNAKCMDYVHLPIICLKKVYRQEDMNFIGLLDGVRDGSLSEEGLKAINSRVCYDDDPDELAITLTSYNADANRINKYHMDALPGESRIYRAVYEGDCSGLKTVVEDTLELKVGAHVVFIVKDNSDLQKARWVNGTMGIVQSMGEGYANVLLENGCTEKVDIFTWHITNVVYDEKSGTKREVETGRIHQIPLRLAWAITIHKSQSMTFEKIRIDVGRGAFTCGQIYVALSRARTLNGIRLNRPIKRDSIMVSQEVLDYSMDENNQAAIDLEMKVASLIDALIAKMRYDEAAQVLLEASKEAEERGNEEMAEQLMERFLRIVIDDRDIHIDSPAKCHSEHMSAVFAFYSGDYSAALEILKGMDELSIDQSYLMMRCAEEMGRKNDCVEMLEDLLFEEDSIRTENLPSDGFRKVLFSAARHFRELGERTALICIDTLMEDVYRYPGTFIVARDLALRSEGLKKDLRKTYKNPESFMGSFISDDDEWFRNQLQSCCEEYTKEVRYNPFLTHIFDTLAEKLFMYRINLTD